MLGSLCSVSLSLSPLALGSLARFPSAFLERGHSVSPSQL